MKMQGAKGVEVVKVVAEIVLPLLPLLPPVGAIKIFFAKLFVAHKITASIASTVKPKTSGGSRTQTPQNLPSVRAAGFVTFSKSNPLLPLTHTHQR
jgi:hypothetical protein